MGRRFFKWPKSFKIKVMKEIDNLLSEIDLDRLYNEHDILSAIQAILHNLYIEENGYYLKIFVTRTSFGFQGSAENLYGADIAFIVELYQNNDRVQKAVIAQGKKGQIQRLDSVKKKELQTQIQQMKQIATAPKVIELPTNKGEYPKVLSGNQVLQGNTSAIKLRLSSYIIRQLLTCIEGNTSSEFIKRVSNSTFQIKIDAGTNTPEIIQMDIFKEEE